MIYQTGSASVVHGSNTVIGTGTKFLTYISKGSLFKIHDEKDVYSIASVDSDTEFTLVFPYKGTTGNLLDYSIISDRTSNIGLPFIDKRDPDAAQVVNAAFSLIDNQVGDFLDFQTLTTVTYSGETAFWIRGDYHTDQLCDGRIIRLDDVNGDMVRYNVVDHNYLFSASINGTPASTTISYDGLTGSIDLISMYDILYNVTKDNYIYISSIVSGEVTIDSAGFMGGGDDWSDNDVIRVYGFTEGWGTITTVTTSQVVVNSTDETGFVVGDLLYNYTRGNTRTILGRVSSTITTNTTTDNWVANDYIYTVKCKITTSMNNLINTIYSVSYGARSQIGTDSVKAEHIDFGYGTNQIDAESIPFSSSLLSSLNVEEALDEVKIDLTAHIISGEGAHAGTSISFVDDGSSIGRPLTSTNVMDAINEIKSMINYSPHIKSTVTEDSDNDWYFVSDSFSLYPSAFFNSGEWWIRMETGVNVGDLRILDTFVPATSTFYTVSGEGFSYAPNEGNEFSLMLKSAESEIIGDFSSYYTKSQLQVSGESNVHWGNIKNVPAAILSPATSTNHALLSNLSYAASSHTGFAPTTHNHTESQITDLDHYKTTDFTVDFSGENLLHLKTRAHSSTTGLDYASSGHTGFRPTAKTSYSLQINSGEDIPSGYDIVIVYGPSAITARKVTLGTYDGQDLEIRGKSTITSNTVRIYSGENLRISGDFTIGSSDVMYLEWFSGENYWIEKNRITKA